MSKSVTNLVVILGLITVAFAGYYLYTQNAANFIPVEEDTAVMENMLRNTQVFIGYGSTLNRVNFNIALFEDDRFRSLRSYTTKIQDRPIGRPDPFADTPTSLRQAE